MGRLFVQRAIRLWTGCLKDQRTGCRSMAPQDRARGTSRVFAHPAAADQSTGGLDRRSTPLHGENNGCEEEEDRQEGHGEEEEVSPLLP